MIRMDYPVSPLAQIRLRLELATRRTRRALEERRRTLRSGAAQRAASRDAYLRLRWQQDLARERRGYGELYEQYDALVGLLCAAAHEGIKPEMEADYRTFRTWFCAQYPALKRAISPFVEMDTSDAQPGRFGRRSCDAFEALFIAKTIEEMFASDGGNLIGRLMRTQTALDGWRESIEQRERACEAR